MDTFTFHHSPFTLLSPLTFHIEIKGQRTNDKALKKVKGKTINVSGGNV